MQLRKIWLIGFLLLIFSFSLAAETKTNPQLKMNRVQQRIEQQKRAEAQLRKQECKKETKANKETKRIQERARVSSVNITQ